MKCVRDDRLVYYKREVGQDFWGGHWAEVLREDYYARFSSGDLPSHYRDLEIFQANDRPVIEAGCGLGQVVLALRARGVDCVGVEYSESTVLKVKEIMPDLPIRHGDVTNLDVPDGYFYGYISLGVMEHFEEGPGVFLKEAHRVLADDGIAYITVPYFNLVRRMKAKLGWFRGEPKGSFYQYAFTKRDFAAEIERHGFIVDRIVGVEPYKGIKDEISAFRYLGELPRIGGYFVEALRRIPLIRDTCGHMVGFFCRKRRG